METLNPDQDSSMGGRGSMFTISLHHHDSQEIPFQLLFAQGKKLQFYQSTFFLRVNNGFHFKHVASTLCCISRSDSWSNFFKDGSARKCLPFWPFTKYQFPHCHLPRVHWSSFADCFLREGEFKTGWLSERLFSSKINLKDTRNAYLLLAHLCVRL